MVDARSLEVTLRVESLAEEVRSRERGMSADEVAEFLEVELTSGRRYRDRLGERPGFKVVKADRPQRPLVVTERSTPAE